MKPKFLIKLLFYFFLFTVIISCENKTSINVFDFESSNNDTVVMDSVPLIQKDTIVQTLKPVIDSTKKYVYLTFDDGPYKGSANINQIVTEEEIKVTAFVVGFNAFTPALKQLIVDYENNPLIELTNHTYSHGNRNKFKQYYNNPDGVVEDVEKNTTFFNLQNKIVRLPGRNTWRFGNVVKNDFDKASRNTSDELARLDYQILGWDYEWNKISKAHPLDNPKKIYDGIMYRFDKNLTESKNHLVLLMHDDMFNKPEDAEKLRTLIKMLKNEPDIVFEFASNYPNSL